MKSKWKTQKSKFSSTNVFFNKNSDFEIDGLKKGVRGVKKSYATMIKKIMECNFKLDFVIPVPGLEPGPVRTKF